MVSFTHRPHPTPGKDPVPIVQETGWSSGPVWTSAENLAPPPGFDPRTVQPVGSRYTNYATRPTHMIVTYTNLFFILCTGFHVVYTQTKFCQGYERLNGA